MMFPDLLPEQWWWYLIPAYLTLWSVAFGLWNFVDGQGMFRQFNIPFEAKSGADAFVLKNSAARYLGVAAALIVGIWLVPTPEAAFTALVARLVMDILDLVAGLQTAVIENPLTGSLQSFLMFLGPNLLTLVLLFAL